MTHRGYVIYVTTRQPICVTGGRGNMVKIGSGQPGSPLTTRDFYIALRGGIISAPMAAFVGRFTHPHRLRTSVGGGL